MDKYYAAGVLTPSQASPARIVPNPDGCRLSVANVHVRASTGGIGYKPTINCTKSPRAGYWHNRVSKRSWLFWLTQHTDDYRLTARDLRTTTFRSGFTYKNINLACANHSKTTWRGDTGSTIRASDGNTYYARVVSNETVLSCGT